MRSELGLWADAVVNATPAMANIRTAVEDELMSKATLHVAQTNGLLPAEAVFIGGTALRLCYGSPRFSVDLDFHTPASVLYSGFDGGLFAKEMEEFIGAKVHVSTPNTEGRSVLARISAELPERNRALRRPRTNIDMARKSQLDASKIAVPLPTGSGTDNLGDLADPVVMRVSSRDEIFVDKHMALVGRARHIKQRDVFDILWLRSQGVVFNADLLVAKLSDLDRENFVSTLRERAESGGRGITNGDYRNEMRQYLPHGSDWLTSSETSGEAFTKIVLDNAKSVDRASARRTVPTPRREGVER